MKQLDAVLFDLDGTLIDTAPDFIRILNQLRNEKDLPHLDGDIIRQQVSNGARAMVELGFDIKEGEAGFEPLRERFLELYLAGLAVDTKLFPGLNELLKKLEANNTPWGIVTNKPSIYTTPLLNQLNLADRCSVSVCPDQVTHRKPHPEPIFKACEQISANPKNTIYVGDHQRDIESGKNAGNLTVAVTWGYIPENQHPNQWKADHVLDTAEELENLVLSFFN